MIKENKQGFFFILLLLSLTFIFWIISVDHSFRAVYNYPTPSCIVGRYMMHFMPLFIVAGVYAASRILLYRDNLKRMYILVAVILMIILVTISKLILFNNLFWAHPFYFANIPFNTPDSIFYKNLFFFCSSLAIIVLTGVSFILMANASNKKSGILYFLVFLMIVLWQGMIFYNAAKRAGKNFMGLHAREIAKVLDHDLSGKITLPVYYSVTGLNNKYLKCVSLFWHGPELIYYPVMDSARVSDTLNNFLFLTQDSLPMNAIISYKYQNGNVNLYNLNLQKLNFEIAILDYGPHKVTHGKKFNIQPSGESLIWLKTGFTSSTMRVHLGNSELKTVIGKNDTIWASVPDSIFHQAAWKKIYLFDEFLKVKSKPVFIEVI